MNIDQDIHMIMVDDNVRNQFRENAVQNVGHLVRQNARRESLCQKLHSKAKEKGCCLSSDTTTDCSKDKAGIQLNYEEFDFLAVASAYDEIEKVTANRNLQDNLQQASTSEEQYTELLEPIPKPHQVQQNDSNVISAVSSVEQSGRTVEQHPANVEETQADESLAKHKALELEIKRILRAVVSQDIMSIVQNPSTVDISDLQTELDRTKEKLENCIIKKEKEYDVLWNDWYKKCEECKYDKISYGKAYNDTEQKIERLQAHLGDQKGKSKDTPYVSNTLDPLSQKQENENVELEFQVLNYAKENEHLKTTYKNLFDSINVTRTQTKLLTNSLQEQLHDTIYEDAKLRA
ncbi:hypothetical protein Tco_1079057 [Tanacetum coccineum]|uniref:Uncharacterized protein n=1 Tax=Tanacetum coccineum TaxID=301880 RepID=A0ABQ5HQT8_9ASTR